MGGTGSTQPRHLVNVLHYLSYRLAQPLYGFTRKVSFKNVPQASSAPLFRRL